MGWQSSPGRLAVAAAGLLGLVNGQAYFGTYNDTLAKCGTDNFVSLGCYANFLNTAGNFFHFSPQGYNPDDPSLSFNGWDPGSHWDSTQTPLDCARTCRAYGYKYSAMRDNNCNCGLQLPADYLPNKDSSAYNAQCSGDSSQTCGGGLNAQVYLDPSFAAPAEVPIVPRNVVLSATYKHLGCYSSNGFNTQDDTRARPLVDDIEACFETCAGLGYPLVFGAREGTQIRCQCGTNFNSGNYRVVPSTLQNPEDCHADCTVDDFSELQGCFVPRTPGFKLSPEQAVQNCYNPPSSLLGPPKVLPNKLSLLNAGNAITSTPALRRPLTVKPGADTWYLHGCYGNYPADVLSLPSQGENQDSIILDINPGTLDECARRCGLNSTYKYFGMVNGGNCYCSASLIGGSLDNMGTCRVPCKSDATQACGGENSPVVYSLNNPSGVFSERQSKLGTGFPTYTCSPRQGPEIEEAPINCPDDNGSSILTAQNQTFLVQCGFEYPGAGGDLGPVTVGSYAACAAACSTTADCVAFIYQHGPPESNGQNVPCYLKSQAALVGAYVSNQGNWAGRLTGTITSSDTSSDTSTSTITSTITSTSTTSSDTSSDTSTSTSIDTSTSTSSDTSSDTSTSTSTSTSTTPTIPPATDLGAITDKVFGQAFQEVFSSFDKVFDINVGDLLNNIPFFKPKTAGSSRAVATSNDEIQDVDTLTSDPVDDMVSAAQANPASAAIGSNAFISDMLSNLNIGGLLSSVPGLENVLSGLDLGSLIPGNIRAPDPATPPKTVNLDELAGLANTVLAALNTLPSDTAVPGSVDTDSLITLAGAITDALTTAADGSGPGVINGKDFAGILNSIFNGIGSIFPKKTTSSSAQPRMTDAPTRRLRARDVAHIGPHPTGVLPPGNGPAQVCDIATLALPANIFAPTPPPDAGRCIPIIGYWYVNETTLLPCSEGYGAGGPQETGSPQAPGFPGGPGGPGGPPPHPAPPSPPPAVVIPVAGSIVLTQEQLNHLLESTNIELESTSEGERVLNIPGVLDMSDSHSDTFRLLLDQSSDSLSHSADQFEIPISGEVGLTQSQLDSLLQDSTLDIFWNSQGARELSIPGVINYSSSRNDTFSLRISSSNHHTTYSAGVPSPTDTPTPTAEDEEPQTSSPADENDGYDEMEAELAALDALIDSFGGIDLDVDLDIPDFDFDVNGLDFPEVPTIEDVDIDAGVAVGDDGLGIDAAIDVGSDGLGVDATVDVPLGGDGLGVDATVDVPLGGDGLGVDATVDVPLGGDGLGVDAAVGLGGDGVGAAIIVVPDEEGAIPVFDPEDPATWVLNGA